MISHCFIGYNPRRAQLDLSSFKPTSISQTTPSQTRNYHSLFFIVCVSAWVMCICIRGLGNTYWWCNRECLHHGPSPSFPSIVRCSPAFYLYGSFRNSPPCICVYYSYKCSCVCFAWSCIQSYLCMCINACVPLALVMTMPCPTRSRSTNPLCQVQLGPVQPIPVSHLTPIHTPAVQSSYILILTSHTSQSSSPITNFHPENPNRESRETTHIPVYRGKCVCVWVCACVCKCICVPKC